MLQILELHADSYVLFHVYACLWTRDILIHLWFFIFSFYEAIWMHFYLKGSQPWLYARKWFTCNSLQLCVRYPKWDSTLNVCLGYGQCLVALYGVFCESWIKFQALYFALYLVISIKTIDQGILWVQVSNY